MPASASRHGSAIADDTGPMFPFAPTPDPDFSPSGVLFEGVTWKRYEAMLRLVGNRPIRVTYHRGTMEVVVPSFAHETDAHLLGRMVETLAGLAGIALKSGRTVTNKRRDLNLGAEPDQCYWFGENAVKMVGKRDLDLAADPAPDLVVEVELPKKSLEMTTLLASLGVADLSVGSVERLPIFAALGVREVWRLSPQGLEFLHLDPETASYLPSPRSLRFPAISSEDVARFLDLGRNEEEIAWIRAFEGHARPL
jgi:Uma2 family endonuclease